MYLHYWHPHKQHSTKAAQIMSFLLHGLTWVRCADGHMHCVCSPQNPTTCMTISQLTLSFPGKTQPISSVTAFTCAAQVCGIKYKRGVQSSVLPAVPADADRVPEPYLLQIVKKPKVRADRKPIAYFKLLTPVNQVQLAHPAHTKLYACW